MTFTIIANILLDALVVLTIVGGLSWAIHSSNPARPSARARRAERPARTPAQAAATATASRRAEGAARSRLSTQS